MAQVINWLERENIGEKNFVSASPKKIMNPCSNLILQQQQDGRPVSASPPLLKKHEHHHHHEHIHHHYHHHFSKETPIIV
jgi:naked cuticle